jgi:ribosomal protein S18 acetylase RimI-like enzyme
MPVALLRAEHRGHWEAARSLVEAYAATLNLDLSFQDFDAEINSLPVIYGPPRGCFLLAQDQEKYIGCVALRALAGGIGEMKRLYVRPEQRSNSTGRALAQAIIEEARKLGYQRLRLDTLPDMHAARALYQSLGFQPVAPYRFNPVPGTSYMELILS